MELTTARLALRYLRPDDWPVVLAYQSDPRYLQFYEHDSRSEESVRPFVDALSSWYAEQPPRRFAYAITLREGGEMIGICSLRRRTATSLVAEFGYELAVHHWGYGYATEAARALVDYSFGTLRLHRMEASCIAENVASIHVLERLGFQRDGRLRHNEFFKGRWWDTLVYSMLEEEWGRSAAYDEA